MNSNKNATKGSKDIIHKLIISCETKEESLPYLKSQPIDIPRKQGFTSVMRYRNSNNSDTSDTSDTYDSYKRT
jgi:hypothetical protein